MCFRLVSLFVYEGDRIPFCGAQRWRNHAGLRPGRTAGGQEVRLQQAPDTHCIRTSLPLLFYHDVREAR
ncbi:unnamed protein product [Ectocarpus sp. 12 AP-2014]